MNSRIFISLIALGALVLGALLVLLTAGQLVKLASIWAGSPEWPKIVRLGALILLEPVLPLMPLIAAGLVFGRLRAEGALVAWAALGTSPLRRYATPALFGVAAGLGGASLAVGPVPDAVQDLRGTLLSAAMHGLTDEGQQVSLPGGGVLQVQDREIWALLPAGERVSVLHAKGAAGRYADDRVALDLGETWLWTPGLRVRVGQGTVALSGDRLAREMGMFGPPNALRSTALDPADVHHRFTWHRRLSLPAMACLWALLGALLGARFGGARAVLCGSVGVAGAYWFLRVGELNARAGLLDPALAAWAPAALLAAALSLWIARSRRIGLG